MNDSTLQYEWMEWGAATAKTAVTPTATSKYYSLPFDNFFLLSAPLPYIYNSELLAMLLLRIFVYVKCNVRVCERACVFMHLSSWPILSMISCTYPEHNTGNVKFSTFTFVSLSFFSLLLMIAHTICRYYMNRLWHMYFQNESPMTLNVCHETQQRLLYHSLYYIFFPLSPSSVWQRCMFSASAHV